MKKIELDDAVYGALLQRIQYFEEPPNNVILRLLNETRTLDSKPKAPSTPDQTVTSVVATKEHPLLSLISSGRYQMCDGKERYFEVLAFLYRDNPDQFAQLEGFKRGSRVNISRDIKKIEDSGTSTNPQKLNGTPYYVMTTLDNKGKRTLLGDILQLLEYPREIVQAVMKSIPDSGISKTRKSILDEYPG